jgi:hypothetical protein
MKNRILLKEIPAGKFHSVIFTTYSINLYYFEQQILPLLGSKGIHYISVLADSNMLNAQLDSYSYLSEQRKRNYALTGIQCNGAFHPKIIFLAGESTLLLLIGSGNLTSSGHGKNLEVWNAIYADNEMDKKMGFIIQAWNYLKQLHADLGISAQYKLRSIEENCQLLSTPDKVATSDTYEIDIQTQISFLASNGSNSIFKQLTTLIGREPINNITVMSPFHDLEGSFLHQLNKQFEPEKIRVILQHDFGTIPVNMEPADNMQFYNWRNIKNSDLKQCYFHAKNLVLEGTNRNFLLSGSANASIAAFGSDSFNATNQEACILYQSTGTDFLEKLELDLNNGKLSLEDFELPPSLNENTNSGGKRIAFIKTAEKNYGYITIYISSKNSVPDAAVCLFNAKGKILFKHESRLEKGESTIKIDIPNDLALLYCEIFSNSTSISNKQFVTDIKAFEETSPSPENRSLNQIRKLIESGSFLTLKIIEYLNTIHKQKEVKKVAPTASAKNDEEAKKEKSEEDETDLLYLSYEEIQEKIKHLEATKKEKGYTEYKSVRLWDSILSYLKENREKEEQAIIDEEETEDINRSVGRADKNESSKKSITKSNYDRLKDKIEKFLLKYAKTLESKIDSKKAEKPNLIDLSMFLIILEILLHLLSHKEKIDSQEKEEHLLQISFTKEEHSWSDFAIRFIGLFTLWCSQKDGFKEMEGQEYKLKLDLFKRSAFKTSISVLSIFSAVNKHINQSAINTWKKLSLLNANSAFNTEHISYKDIQEFELFVPQNTRSEIGEPFFFEELNECLRIINKPIFDNEFYLHPTDGITFIKKEIITRHNNSNKLLKLINTGYHWNEGINDYWNGKFYSINDSKWLRSKKE